MTKVYLRSIIFGRRTAYIFNSQKQHLFHVMAALLFTTCLLFVTINQAEAFMCDISDLRISENCFYFPGEFPGPLTLNLGCPEGCKIKIVEAIYTRPNNTAYDHNCYNNGQNNEWYCCDQWKDFITNCAISMEEYSIETHRAYNTIANTCNGNPTCVADIPLENFPSECCLLSGNNRHDSCRARRSKVKYYCYQEEFDCPTSSIPLTDTTKHDKTETASVFTSTGGNQPTCDCESQSTNSVSVTPPEISNNCTPLLESTNSIGNFQAQIDEKEKQLSSAKTSLGIALGLTIPTSLVLGAIVMFAIMRLRMKRTKDYSLENNNNSSHPKFTPTEVSKNGYEPSTIYSPDDNPHYEGELETSMVDRSLPPQDHSVDNRHYSSSPVSQKQYTGHPANQSTISAHYEMIEKHYYEGQSQNTHFQESTTNPFYMLDNNHGSYMLFPKGNGWSSL